MGAADGHVDAPNAIVERTAICERDDLGGRVGDVGALTFAPRDDIDHRGVVRSAAADGVLSERRCHPIRPLWHLPEGRIADHDAYRAVGVGAVGDGESVAARVVEGDGAELPDAVEPTQVDLEDELLRQRRVRVRPPDVQQHRPHRQRAPHQSVEPVGAIAAVGIRRQVIQVVSHLDPHLDRGGHHRWFVEVVEPHVACQIGDGLLASLGGRHHTVESLTHRRVCVVAERIAIHQTTLENRSDDRAQFAQPRERPEQPHHRRLERRCPLQAAHAEAVEGPL